MLDLDLPPIALDLLSTRDASRAGHTANADQLSALLAERRYPAHPSVLAFEASYGGFQLIETDPSAPALVVGAYACLSAGPYNSHERHLVPVIFAWNDVVYSLDEEGRGYTCAAMVEGVSRQAARDGRQLLTQAILWRALTTHAGASAMFEGFQGEARAKELGLASIEDASSEGERWWGDARRLVVEIERGNGYEVPMTFIAK